MPCYRVVMSDKNKVYNLADLIAQQWPVDAGQPKISEGWRSISVQSHYDNDQANPIKVGDSDMSGLKYGRLLMPGETKMWHLGTPYVYTKDLNFLCEGAANQELLVELL